MKIQLTYFFLLTIAIISCSETKTPETTLQASPDSTQFFAMGSFFEEQVKQVILFKKPVYVYHNINDKKDSAVLNSIQLMQLAQEFISKDISNKADKKHYRETVFQDAGTNSYTLNYAAVDRKVPVQGIDILLDEQTNQVKRIFIRSFTSRGDTSIQEQYNWRAFKGFQINRSLTAPNGYKQQQLTEVKWGNPSADE
ncbi:MAG: hypothetical protein ACOYVG_10560 [Bacteroidota bacterium]